MNVDRATEVIDMVTQWVTLYEQALEDGARSARVQFDVADHADALTILATRKRGVVVIEPSAAPVPAREWLAR